MSVRYNIDTDYVQILYKGAWINIIYAGCNAKYLINEKSGLLCGYSKGNYTIVSVDNNYLEAYATNASQTQWVLFNESLSDYIGLNKKIRLKCYFTSTSNFTMCKVKGTNSSASSGSNEIAFSPSLSEKEYLFDLDSLLTDETPYFTIVWSNSSAVHLRVTEIAIIIG